MVQCFMWCVSEFMYFSHKLSETEFSFLVYISRIPLPCVIFFTVLIKLIEVIPIHFASHWHFFYQRLVMQKLNTGVSVYKERKSIVDLKRVKHVPQQTSSYLSKCSNRRKYNTIYILNRNFYGTLYIFHKTA